MIPGQFDNYSIVEIETYKTSRVYLSIYLSFLESFVDWLVANIYNNCWYWFFVLLIIGDIFGHCYCGMMLSKSVTTGRCVEMEGGVTTSMNQHHYPSKARVEWITNLFLFLQNDEVSIGRGTSHESRCACIHPYFVNRIHQGENGTHYTLMVSKTPLRYFTWK